jgi:hypothetical protein
MPGRELFQKRGIVNGRDAPVLFNFVKHPGQGHFTETEMMAVRFPVRGQVYQAGPFGFLSIGLFNSGQKSGSGFQKAFVRYGSGHRAVVEEYVDV